MVFTRFLQLLVINLVYFNTIDAQEIQHVSGQSTNLTVLQITSRSISLQWERPNNANPAVIEYKLASGAWVNHTNRILEPQDRSSASITSLRPGTSYHLRIVYYNDAGTSEASDIITVVTLEEAPSGPPLNLTLYQMGPRDLRVVWKPPQKDLWNGDILGYYVGYKKTRGPNRPYKFKTVGKGAELSVVIHHLKVSTQYTIVVQAFNKIGSGPMCDEVQEFTTNVISLSDVNILSVETRVAPSGPPLDCMLSQVDQHTLRVYWKEPMNTEITGYYIGHKKTNDGDTSVPFVFTTISEGTANSFTLEGLDAFTQYTVVVQAFNKIGQGHLSEEVKEFTTAACIEPEVPGARKFLRTSSGSVTLNLDAWSQEGCHINHFVIKYKQRADREWTLVSSNVKPGGNYVVLDLAPATWYKLKVTAHSTAGLTLAEYEFPTLNRNGGRIGGITGGIAGESTTEGTHGDQLNCTHRAAPKARSFLGSSARSVTIYLNALLVEGCPISFYVIEYKQRTQTEWTVVSNNVQNGGNYVVLGLDPATWYTIRVSSHNNAGFFTVEYEFTTLLTNGDIIGSTLSTPYERACGNPTPPDAMSFLVESTNSVNIHLDTLVDVGCSGCVGCSMNFFIIEYKPVEQSEWILVSNGGQFGPGGSFVIADLDSLTSYNLKVTGHADAGFSHAEYEFTTLFDDIFQIQSI